MCIERRWASVLLVLAAGACDAGKGPYQEGVDLEEKGQLADAAAKYDGVCRRAPDSKLCPAATERAAALRLKLAQQDTEAMKFADAETLLKTVQESGDAASKDKAKAQLGGKELTAGLAYEKALVNADKHAALATFETVAASGTPVAPKATEWLTKERPGLLLADATSACAAKPPNTCPSVCERLTKLHPGTPEAGKAAVLLAAYQAADAERLYPLLTEAEGLMAQCQSFWRQNEVHSKCIVNQIAATGDGLSALATCGEADQKTEEKLTASFDRLTGEIATPSVVDPLKERFTAACKDGEYKRAVIANPATATQAPSTKARGPSGNITYCPPGVDAWGMRMGCYCGDMSKPAPRPTGANCVMDWPKTRGNACIWNCK